MLKIFNLHLLSIQAKGFMFSDLPALILFWHVQASTGGTYEEERPALEIFPSIANVNSA
jgi:hypothetical protein